MGVNLSLSSNGFPNQAVIFIEYFKCIFFFVAFFLWGSKTFIAGKADPPVTPGFTDPPGDLPGS